LRPSWFFRFIETNRSGFCFRTSCRTGGPGAAKQESHYSVAVFGEFKICLKAASQLFLSQSICN